MDHVTCVLHHHIGSEGPFEKGLGITSSRQGYSDQIAWLVHNYNIVSLDRMLSGDIPKNALLLTFDDAFRSVRDVVREVLVPRELPSVFFINPGLLEPGAISLDSALAWAKHKAGLASICNTLEIPLRQDIGTILREDMANCGSAERNALRERLLATYGPPDFSKRAPLLSAADLEELVSLGVEIGNHTMNHVHCRSLSPEEMKTEIVVAKKELERLSNAKVRAFSMPYGHERDLTPEVLETIRASGHEAIFLVHSRSNRWRPAHDIWYRTSLHDEAPNVLHTALRIKPWMRSIKTMIRL